MKVYSIACLCQEFCARQQRKNMIDCFIMKQSFSSILDKLQTTLQLLKRKRLEALYRADQRYQQEHISVVQKDIDQQEHQPQIQK